VHSELHGECASSVLLLRADAVRGLAPLQEKKKDVPASGDVEGASVEELNQKIGTLEKEKNKEEEYRNYMQLERVRWGVRRRNGRRTEPRRQQAAPAAVVGV
jgi:hypothetical protein